MQNTILQNKIEKGSMKELFTLDGSRRALLICCGLVTFQQISGISIVCFYSQKILQMTGTDISSGTCSIIFGIIMLLSAFIAPVAVKKMGYKIPLLLSILGMALGMVSKSLWNYSKTESQYFLFPEYNFIKFSPIQPNKFIKKQIK